MSSAITKPALTPVPSPPSVPKPPLASAPKRPLWRWGLVLLAIALVAAVAYRRFSQPPQQAVPVAVARTVKAVSGNVVHTIRVTGQTAARNYTNIVAPILRGPEGRSPMILQTLAKSGSFVKRGDVVAQIDSQSSLDHIDDVRDMVTQAQNDIEKRKAEQAVEIERLLQNVRVTKANLDKARLDAKAAETRTIIDQELIRLVVEESDAQHKQALADVEVKRRGHTAELRILEITLERQRRHLDRHDVDLKRFAMRAGMDGLVVMESIWRGAEMGQVQEGDQVNSGQRFMKIVNQSSMQVDASVNQTQVARLRVGAPATISFDAFPGMTFPGKVFSIGALAVGGWRNSFHIRTVPVKILIEGSDPRLIPDLSAAADVVIERADNVVTAPLSAIRSENGKNWVRVRKGDHFETREVELGLANNTNAAVLSGLAAGEEIRID
jgi:HlyD family secretion protein